MAYAVSVTVRLRKRDYSGSSITRVVSFDWSGELDDPMLRRHAVAMAQEPFPGWRGEVLSTESRPLTSD
ncbi:MAG: hypothetical protein HKN47_17575 [Pirellulaceae bacterium]|nr:hypothetical protein [Pirellulaceae bacterium]